MLLEHVFLHDEAISSGLKIPQLSQLHFFDICLFIVDKYLKNKSSVSFIKQQNYIFLSLETEDSQYRKRQASDSTDLPENLLQYEIWSCQTHRIFSVVRIRVSVPMMIVMEPLLL